MCAIAAVTPSPWRRRFSIAWAVLLAASLVSLFMMFRDVDVEGYRALGWRQILFNIPVVVSVFLLTKQLLRVHPWLAWKPSDLIFAPRPGLPDTDGSLLIKAMKAPWIGPVVTVLLALNLPIIAMLEEFIFRNGTAGWRSAALRSLLFGLAHLTANVPVGASLAVGLTGFWFTYWYFEGGLALAAGMHFGYILIVIGLSAPAVLWQHLKRQIR